MKVDQLIEKWNKINSQTRLTEEKTVKCLKSILKQYYKITKKTEYSFYREIPFTSSIENNNYITGIEYDKKNNCVRLQTKYPFLKKPVLSGENIIPILEEIKLLEFYDY